MNFMKGIFYGLFLRFFRGFFSGFFPDADHDSLFERGPFGFRLSRHESADVASFVGESVEVVHQRGAGVGDYELLYADVPQRRDEVADILLPTESAESVRGHFPAGVRGPFLLAVVVRPEGPAGAEA